MTLKGDCVRSIIGSWASIGEVLDYVAAGPARLEWWAQRSDYETVATVGRLEVWRNGKRSRVMYTWWANWSHADTLAI